MDDSLRSIVEDAILRRRITVVGERSLIVFNDAAEELLDSGEAGIEAIETVVRDMVLSADSLDEFTVLRHFSGLPATLTTYFRLWGARSSDIPKASMDFVKSLRGEVLVQAVEAIWSVWGDKADVVNVPQGIIVHLREVGTTDRGRAGQLAQSFCERHDGCTSLGPLVPPRQGHEGLETS